MAEQKTAQTVSEEQDVFLGGPLSEGSQETEEAETPILDIDKDDPLFRQETPNEEKQEDTEDTGASEDDAEDAQEEVETEAATDESEEDDGLLPALDAQLVQDARDWGLPDDVIDAFDSDEQLEAWLNRQVSNVDRFHQQQPQQQPEQQQQAEVPGEFKLELDEEELDAAQIKVLKQLAGQLDKQQKHMQQQFGLVAQYIQQQHQAERANHFQSLVSGLGDEWEDVFGKGSYENQTGRMKRNWDEAWQEFLIQSDAAAQAGRNVSGSQLMRRVLATLHPNHQKSAARKEVAKGVKRRRRRAVSKPTPPKKSDDVLGPGEELARSVIKKKFEELGIRGID